MGSVFNKTCGALLYFIVVISIISCVGASAAVRNNNAASSDISPELAKEMRLTKSEKLALDKLKQTLPKNLMDYLYLDLFQIRWLRAKNLDVERTRRDMIKFKEFRREHEIPNFVQKDWSDMFEEQPFSMEGFDKDGRPLGYITVGEGWDVRRLILQGKRHRLQEYVTNVALTLLDTVIEENKKHANITQMVFLFNLDGFTAVQHICPMCVSTYLHLLQLYEMYLPGFAHDIIFFNCPSVWNILLEMIRPVLSDHTNSVIKFFDTNKNNWKPFIDARIDPSQLPYEFGGTKEKKEKERR